MKSWRFSRQGPCEGPGCSRPSALRSVMMSVITLCQNRLRPAASTRTASS